MSTHYDDVVFVTGFPSFFARRLVLQLLRDEPTTRVYAVVLNELEREADEVIASLDPALAERLICLSGDAAAMDLGLSGAEFRMLAREVGRIHHCAHASRAGTSRSTAEKLNVGGVVEIIELGRAASRLRCLTLHSTALVSGDRTGVVYEDDLDKGQGFRNVIEETRMKGELFARRLMGKIPIAVVRPTTMVGEADRGALERFDSFYLLVLFVLAAPAELSLPPLRLGDVPVNVIPVDYAVRASLAIGKHPRAPGKTFHLVDRFPLSARRVVELISRRAGPRGKSAPPASLAKVLLRTPGVERLVRSPRALASELAHAVRYDARNTEQLLAGSGIACAPFEAYVDDAVALVQAHVRRLGEPRRPAAPEGREPAELDDPLS